MWAWHSSQMGHLKLSGRKGVLPPNLVARGSAPCPAPCPAPCSCPASCRVGVQATRLSWGQAASAASTSGPASMVITVSTLQPVASFSLSPGHLNWLRCVV